MTPDRPIDITLLNELEQGLNVRWPEKSRLPARVLGYGEISTVLEIQSAHTAGLAYKRMPMFRNEAEVTQYAALYEEYVDVLHNRGGIRQGIAKLVMVGDDQIDTELACDVGGLERRDATLRHRLGHAQIAVCAPWPARRAPRTVTGRRRSRSAGVAGHRPGARRQ